MTGTKPSYAVERKRLTQEGLEAGFALGHLEDQLNLLEELGGLRTDEEVAAGKGSPWGGEPLTLKGALALKAPILVKEA